MRKLTRAALAITLITLAHAPAVTVAAEPEAGSGARTNWSVLAAFACTPIIVPVPAMTIGPSWELCHFMIKVSELFES
jgi:hypothetical protein